VEELPGLDDYGLSISNRKTGRIFFENVSKYLNFGASPIIDV
tara:strand:+ start:324 stop:449 length:126 start_codon:yes stop_codon:yes gene_type:complete